MDPNEDIEQVQDTSAESVTDNTPDISEADLDALVKAARSGDPSPAPSASLTEGDQAAHPGTEQEDPPNTQEATQPRPGTRAAARETKPAQAPKPPAQDPKPKETREAQRQARAWKGINASKADLDRREAEIARRERELSNRPPPARKEPSKPADPQAPTPEDYEAYAARAEAKGDTRMAELARTEAKAMRDKAKAEQDAQDAQDRKTRGMDAILPEDQFRARQAEAFSAAATEFPELKIKGSPLNSAVSSMIRQEKVVKDLVDSVPNGIYFVARYAAEAAKAARVPDLESQVATLQKELQTLRLATTPLPPGGTAAGQPQDENWDSKTADEMERELDRMMARG